MLYLIVYGAPKRGFFCVLAKSLIIDTVIAGLLIVAQMEAKMGVQTFFIKYRLFQSSEEPMFKVLASEDQMVELVTNENSNLWIELNRLIVIELHNRRIIEELTEDYSHGFFGGVILSNLREGIFEGVIGEIDITDIAIVEVPGVIRPDNSILERALSAIRRVFGHEEKIVPNSDA